MHVVSTVQEFRDWCRAVQRPLGLVPTMGALHDGHLGLVRQARAECAAVAVTIFVNPVQFDRPADLEQYPRTHERDLGLLKKAEVDAVFLPASDEMYPPGFATRVQVAGPALPLEGAERPGHFQGVATVITKLLLIAMPDMAYFGQKDAQQVAVLRRLVADLNIPTQVRVVPTVQEADGLAMSSRNAHLTSQEREAAPVVYRALQAAETLYAEGECEAEALERACLTVLEAEPLVEKVDYAALVNPLTFDHLNRMADGPAVLVVAVRMGMTRLIDNVVLGGEGQQSA